MTEQNQDHYVFCEDTNHEGRDKAFLDIDRMINEGLAGGTVHTHKQATNIEESRELAKEDPPFKITE